MIIIMSHRLYSDILCFIHLDQCLVSDKTVLSVNCSNKTCCRGSDHVSSVFRDV